MISRTAEYALRSIVFLAGTEGGPRTTRQIAKVTHVRQEYLAKVLRALRRAGLVKARPGVKGGFVLARPPDQVTVLEVVGAVDPVRRIRNCPLGLVSHKRQLCPLHARLDAAADAVERAFRETTIADLLVSHSRRRDRCPFPEQRREKAR